MVFVATTQLCHFSSKVAIDNMETNKHGYSPIKLDVWILKFEFHVIFISQNFFSTT